MLNILYCNLNRSRGAFDMMIKTAKDKRADILLCSEPNKSRICGTTWYTDTDLDVGILLTGSVKVSSRGCGKGFVWMQVENVKIFSCYISPNSNYESFKTLINDLRNAIRGSGPCITGDFNAKHKLWGSKRNDRRG